MKVLLIDIIIRGIPLSLRTLATYAEHDSIIKENIEFDLLEFKPGEDLTSFLKSLYNIEGRDSLETIGLDLEEYIRECDPQVIALSIWLYNFLYVKTLCKFISQKFPHIKIITGGAGILFPEKFFPEHEEIEIHCYGKQGEESFIDIFKHYLGLVPLESINGIYYRQGSAMVKNDYTEQRLDASKTLGVYNRFPIKDNKHQLNSVRIMYEIKRGCPFKCTYCSWGNILYPFAKDLDKCIEEINTLPDNSRLEIVDASLNTPDHIYVLSNIKTTFKRITFCSNLALFPNKVEEFFKVLSRFPEVILEVGIQSLQPKIIKAINRKDYSDRLQHWLAIRPSNVTFDLQIMLGLPYQTAEIVKDELEILSSYKQLISLSPLHALLSTDVWENHLDWGAEFEKEYPFEVLKTDYLTEEECATFRRNRAYIEANLKSRTHEEFVEWLHNLEFEAGYIPRDQAYYVRGDGDYN